MPKQKQALTLAADDFAAADELIKAMEAQKERARDVFKRDGGAVFYTSDGRAITRRDMTRTDVDTKAAAASDPKIAKALEAFKRVTSYCTFSVAKKTESADA